jgi:CRP-like cAMP-binding protein
MQALLRSNVVLTNRLLAALPTAEFERLAPHLHRVKLKENQILFEVKDDVQQVHFVESGIVALISMTDEGDSIETGMVGFEGIVGIPSVMRYHRAPFRAQVQTPGEAFTLDRQMLRQEFKKGGALQEVILCFTHTLITHFAHSIACNHFHTVDKRLARWLLMTRDRVRGNSFHLTHKLLSDMIGTSRSDITRAAGELQKTGVIDYKRGNITILDDDKLENAACACYRTMQEEIEMFLKE